MSGLCPLRTLIASKFSLKMGLNGHKTEKKIRMGLCLGGVFCPRSSKRTKLDKLHPWLELALPRKNRLQYVLVQYKGLDLTE